MYTYSIPEDDTTSYWGTYLCMVAKIARKDFQRGACGSKWIIKHAISTLPQRIRAGPPAF